jgi:hypothetical protein
MGKNTNTSRLLVFLFSTLLALAGCSGKVDGLRDDLVKGQAPSVEAPRCAGYDVVEKKSACLTAIARAFGAKRDFDVAYPDQADAAAVAVVLVRERRGDWVPAPDTWTLAEQTARGPGADALRLAAAARMQELAPRVGKRVDDDGEAGALAHDIATALPGACPEYALLGAGVDPAALPPEKSPDHAPCIQRDLVRRDGPGAKYGYGNFRALAGIVAMWKDEARSLRAGVAFTSEGARAALEKRLAEVDQATAKLDMKHVDAPGQWVEPH